MTGDSHDLSADLSAPTSSAAVGQAPEVDPPSSATVTLLEPELGAPIRRIPVARSRPVIEGGAYPAKATVGEPFPIRAKVFREGHDAVNASVVLTAPTASRRGSMHRPRPLGFDGWAAWVRPDDRGAWTFRVEGWCDPWGTWLHNAEIKLPAGVDVDWSAPRATRSSRAAAARADAAGDPARPRSSAGRRNPDSARNRSRTGSRWCWPTTCARRWPAFGPRELVSPTPDYPLWVDRNGRCSRPGTSSSPAPRGPASTPRPTPGSPARSTPRTNAWRRPPRWASTSSTCRRSTRSGVPSGRARTTP